jgi:predicted AlkP superfamily phosphohydrolase/phosphomutase
VPGNEYSQVCCLLTEGLQSFVDADSGDPMVEEFGRPNDLYGDGSRAALLPDLIVRWAPSPAHRHRTIISNTLGTIAWPTPGRHPSGRSGNHRPDGFLVAVGPQIHQRGRLKRAHIVDLAPTLYALLGLNGPPEGQGKALEELVPSVPPGPY